MSDKIAVQYDNILTFRAQELQHESSLKLTQLVQADAVENKDMAILADLTYKDSRTMRIATVIAMFYLPANLVMVRRLTPCSTFRSISRSGSGRLSSFLYRKMSNSSKPSLTSILQHPVILQQHSCMVRYIC